jgi:uncharacterized protein (TIGR04222 family)
MARPLLASIRRKLEQLGLYEGNDVTTRLGRASALVMLIAVVFGAAKINVGMSRGKPVAFLVVLTVVAAVTAVAFLNAPQRRSRTGDDVLRMLRDRYAALEATARTRSESVTPNDLALSVGLFGVAVLYGTAHASLVRAMAPQSSGDGSGGGSDGGGGCGGGCGGGGCGGCGG